MKGNSTLLPVAALCAVITILFIPLFISVSKEAPPEQFPKKLQERVLLPQTGQGKTIVFEHYRSSSGRPQLDSSTAYWNEDHNSVIEDVEYRPDRSVSKSVKYFPVNQTDERAGIRRIALYNPDGTFFKHEVYRKDGSLERIGAYIPSTDQYIQTYYFEDGKTVQRNRTFNREMQTRYRNSEINGFSHVLKVSLRTNRFIMVKEEVFKFTEQGRVISSLISCGSEGQHCFRKVFNSKGGQISNVLEGGNVKERGEIFTSDGKQLLCDYELTFGLNPSTINFYRKDGTRWQSLSSQSDVTQILHFDSSGKKLLAKQIWQGPPTDSKNLRRVELFDSQSGMRDAIVYMSETNYSIDRVAYPLDGSKFLEMQLNAQKEVTKTVIKTLDGPESSEIQGPGQKLFFDETYFKWEYPLALSDYNFNDHNSPAWIYDYEDSEEPKPPKRFP